MTDFTDDTKTFSVTLTAPVATAARGSLVNVSCPPTAERGGRISIRAAVRNIGDQTGTFRLEIAGGLMGARTSTFSVAGGGTSPTRTLNGLAPHTGSSVTMVLKCIRIT